MRHIELDCVRGIQGGRSYYTAMVPLAYVGKMLDDGTTDDDMPAVYKVQRKTNKGRARKLGQYILENYRTYVLPALTVSAALEIDINTKVVDREHPLEFFPHSDGSLSGKLVIHKDAKLIVNDGLHRRLGIVLAMREWNQMDDKQRRAWKKKHGSLNPPDDTIPVTVYWDAGIERAQQMFVDINKNASKPNTALSMTFDHRDRDNETARTIAQKVFPGRIEYERATAKDGKLFSINAVVAAVKTLRNAWYGDEEPNLDELIDFFNRLAEAMSDHWNTGKTLVDVLAETEGESEGTPAPLCQQNIALEAISIALSTQSAWKSKLKKLAELDWSRDAQQWAECNVVVDGRIIKTKKSTEAMAASILRSVQRRAS